MKRHDEIAAVLELLCETFPRAFSLYEGRRKPLKIGVHNDVIAALDGAVTWRELRNALRVYVNNERYLCALRAGTPRIDLNGEPAGVVTEGEAQHAKALLIARHRKKGIVRNDSAPERKKANKNNRDSAENSALSGAQAAKVVVERSKSNTPALRPGAAPSLGEAPMATSTPEIPPPKRLGLADLKAAALLRKQAAPTMSAKTRSIEDLQDQENPT
jgi:ProP effector